MDLINDTHPSYGTENAIFTFMVNGEVFVLEASNRGEVHFIERVICHSRGSINCLFVVRGHENIGVRNEEIQQISMFDFNPSKF
jgi:hypothetical protein